MDKKTERQKKTTQGLKTLSKTIQEARQRNDEPRAKHAATKPTPKSKQT